jgi:hypothetical protein
MIPLRPRSALMLTLFKIGKTMSLDTLLQNISDCSGAATSKVNTVTALIVALIAFGEKAYPYIVKIIEATSDLFVELSTAGGVLEKYYAEVVEKLEAMKVMIVAKLADNGVVDDETLSAWIASISAMASAHDAALEEAKALENAGE